MKWNVRNVDLTPYFHLQLDKLREMPESNFLYCTPLTFEKFKFECDCWSYGVFALSKLSFFSISLLMYLFYVNFVFLEVPKFRYP